MVCVLDVWTEWDLSKRCHGATPPLKNSAFKHLYALTLKSNKALFALAMYYTYKEKIGISTAIDVHINGFGSLTAVLDWGMPSVLKNGKVAAVSNVDRAEQVASGGLTTSEHSRPCTQGWPPQDGLHTTSKGRPGSPPSALWQMQNSKSNQSRF
jgi:hypothetical protein